GVVLGANLLDPAWRRIGIAFILFRHRPGSAQRVVNGGDFVVHDVWIGFVLVDPLLDDGLVVGMQRKAVGAVGTLAFHAAGLDFQRVVAAVAVSIEPLADGIALVARLDLLRPVAPVGIDAAIVMD